MNDPFDCECGGISERACSLCYGTGKLSVNVALTLANGVLGAAHTEIENILQFIRHKENHIKALYAYKYTMEPIVDIEVTQTHIRKMRLDSWEHRLTRSFEEKFKRVVVFQDHVCVGHDDFTHRATLPTVARAFDDLKYKKLMTPFVFAIHLQSITETERKFAREMELCPQ